VATFNKNIHLQQMRGLMLGEDLSKDLPCLNGIVHLYHVIINDQEIDLTTKNE
jgi:hypothetical protein